MAIVGTRLDSWLADLMLRLVSSCSVNIELLSGCLRSRNTSFGGDTTTSSSRSTTFDVSTKVSNVFEASLLPDALALVMLNDNSVVMKITTLFIIVFFTVGLNFGAKV